MTSSGTSAYTTPDSPANELQLGLLPGASCVVSGAHASFAAPRPPMPSSYPGAGQIYGHYLATHCAA